MVLFPTALKLEPLKRSLTLITALLLVVRLNSWASLCDPVYQSCDFWHSFHLLSLSPLNVTLTLTGFLPYTQPKLNPQGLIYSAGKIIKA